MKLNAGCLLVIVFAISLAEPNAAIGAPYHSSAAARAEAKVQHIEKNAELAHPDPTPTQFTDEEINGYFAAGKVKLPAGVKSVTFEEQPGVVTASCRVDFDQVKGGRGSANPLLSLFSGVHDVVVVANARGAGRQGTVDVQSVSLDGVEVPKFILELFVEKFIQPKYPYVGLNSRFALPDRIDSAVVGEQNLSVTQE